MRKYLFILYISGDLIDNDLRTFEYLILKIDLLN